MKRGATGGANLPRTRCRIAVLLLILLGALPWSAFGQGRWVKLSDGFPFSDVLNFKISADGDRVVYLHDAQTDNAIELWSVPITGGTPPVRLSGVLPAISLGFEFEISADSSRVVYVAPQDDFDVFELYSVPIAGGVATKLNGVLPAGGDVVRFQISPDGNRVVFQADQDDDNVFEVYSVPIGGGAAPVKLNGALVNGGNVRSFLVSPNGSRVIYRADQRADTVNEIFSAPITGAAPAVVLNGPLITNGDVVADAFLISPDSSRVLYLADQQIDERTELYSVPIAGGTAVKLNGAIVPGGAVARAAISADGSRVIYLADQQADEVFELYSVPIGGAAGAVKLNGTLVSGGDVVDDFAVSPDSSRVVYRADQQTNGVFELYSAPIDGAAAPVRLNGNLVSDGDVITFEISPDNDWVVYYADQVTDGQPLGYRAPLAGPAGNAEAIWIHAVAQAGRPFTIDPSGRHAVVHSDFFFDGVVRLWRANLAILPIPAVSELIPAADIVPNGGVLRYAIGPRGSIVYVADQDTDDVNELYAIPDRLFGDGFE